MLAMVSSNSSAETVGFVFSGFLFSCSMFLFLPPTAFYYTPIRRRLQPLICRQVRQGGGIAGPSSVIRACPSDLLMPHLPWDIIIPEKTDVNEHESTV